METYDYTDPVCPFNTEQYDKKPKVRSIPVDRILNKLDGHLDKNDGDGGIKLLQYWLSEARLGGDEKGELAMLNELMGISRTSGDKENAFKYAKEALALAEKTGLSKSVTGATVSLNAATVYKAFGEPQKAVELYENTEKIYKEFLPENDYRVGSLYNNMGLACVEIKDFDKAETLYKKAIAVMEELEGREPEQAITYLNIADLIYAKEGAEEGEEKINACLDKAEALLDAAKKRDGKYAFMCSHCASVFGFYGRFLYEEELKKRAAEIYDGN